MHFCLTPRGLGRCTCICQRSHTLTGRYAGELYWPKLVRIQSSISKKGLLPKAIPQKKILYLFCEKKFSLILYKVLSSLWWHCRFVYEAIIQYIQMTDILFPEAGAGVKLKWLWVKLWWLCRDWHKRVCVCVGRNPIHIYLGITAQFYWVSEPLELAFRWQIVF